MDENQNTGGPGPALAAHSKDGSAPGQTSASQAAGETGQPTGAKAPAGQARQAAEWMTSSMSDVTHRAREITAQGGDAAKQAADLVRGQPLTAVAVTGVVCLMLGMLIGRR